MKEKVRQILEQEYYTPPIVSGKIWQDRATERICQLYEDKIQQAKTEAAREIFEELNKLIYENKEPSPPVAEMWLEDWQAFKESKGVE